MARFQGKKAVVTGAAGAVGQLLCSALIGEGATVIGTDVDETAGKQLTEKLAASGAAFTFHHVDISDPATVAEFGASCGAVDVLINAAGVLAFAPVVEESFEEWDRVCNINLRGAFLMTKALASSLRRGGAIVNISSAVALKVSAGWAAYSSSKAALIAFSKVSAAELAPHVRVNVVCPGGLDTQMPHRLLEGHPEKDEIMAAIARGTMLGRLGEAHEVVPLCLFLASDDASLITGAMIPIDGGLTAW